MNIDIGLLMVTAVSIGFLHTLLGPDHYVPFVAMSAARRWSLRKTLWITAFCGVGHVLGSLVIGGIGIAVGLSLRSLQWFEGMRGDVAAWGLIAFGLVYMSWGLKRAARNRPHTHEHAHGDGHLHRHVHVHSHRDGHAHVHVDPARAASITPWALFVVFVLGPCEPLIPILMYPAAKHSALGVGLVVVAFGATTILTMVSVVCLALLGIDRLPMAAAERYAHALAGAALSICGMGIVFLGL
jgi:sulfite exporter TauE/SafE